jgi:hypothetical protein
MSHLDEENRLIEARQAAQEHLWEVRARLIKQDPSDPTLKWLPSDQKGLKELAAAEDLLQKTEDDIKLFKSRYY